MEPIKAMAMLQLIVVETAITHFYLNSHWYPKTKVTSEPMVTMNCV